MKNDTHSKLLEHNVFIVWQPEYNLGIPILDEQHRGIVTIINSLNFGMQNNYISENLKSIADMMDSYSKIHFRIEEDFFEVINFPDAKEHKNSHKELLFQFGRIRKDSLLNNDPHQLMEFLKNWWISHICNEDIKYRDYIQKM